MDCGANTTCSIRRPVLSNSTSNTSLYSPSTVSPSTVATVTACRQVYFLAGQLEVLFLGRELLDNLVYRDAVGLSSIQLALTAVVSAQGGCRQAEEKQQQGRQERKLGSETHTDLS